MGRNGAQRRGTEGKDWTRWDRQERTGVAWRDGESSGTAGYARRGFEGRRKDWTGPDRKGRRGGAANRWSRKGKARQERR